MSVDHEVARAPSGERSSRARGLGITAGLVAVGCCIYPTALALLGLAGASEAIALGNRLYGRWGWVFRGGGAGLAVAGIVVQLRRRGACTVRGAKEHRGLILRVALIGTVVYLAIYGVTKGLAAWAS